MPCAFGIDLGGSSVKAVAISRTGQTLAKKISPFEEGRDRQWARKIQEVIQDFSRELKIRHPYLGLAAPGLASADGRAIAYMPGRLRGLEQLDWTKFLRSSRPVKVLNDAQAALLGEAWVGAARGYTNVLMLTLGTGVGGAAIVDGKLLHGEIGRAGHLGHTCLDPDGTPDVCRVPGSLEMAIGNCTVSQRSGGRFQSTSQLLSAARAGDAEAQTIWLKSVKQLACAIASFVNILDPAAVVIGGGIAAAGADLFRPLRKMLRPIEWQPGGHRVEIRPAELGEFAGAYGAARNGMGQAQRWRLQRGGERRRTKQ